MTLGNIIVGLDIGTSKVVVTVAEVNEYGQINIIGMGRTASTGLKKGLIVDIDRTVKGIKEAVEAAERMSGVEISGVTVGIGGQHISSLKSRGVVGISNAEKEVTPNDVQRVLQASKVVTLPPDRRIIHCLPRQYFMDGNDGIIDPVGMSGERLEVETIIVTGLATAIQNIIKSVALADLQVVELVLNPLASANAVLQPAEKDLGCVLVDIGGGTTEITIFDEGSLWWTGIVPIGGDHITSDLAVGLRAPIDLAEKVKMEHGCVLTELVPDDEYISVPGVEKQEVKQVSKKFVSSIIKPRVQEMLAMVKDQVTRSNYSGMLPGGIIISGGIAGLEGLSQLAAQELGLPVRIGRPDGVGGLFDMAEDPSYATSIGLLIHGSNQLAYQETAADGQTLSRVWGKLSGWLRDYLGL